MSQTFTLAGSRPISLRGVLQRLGLDDVETRDDSPADDRWPLGIARFHRRFLSTRSTEIARSEASFQIRVMSFAAREDAELALRFIEVLADEVGVARVDTEIAGEVALEELHSTFDEEWLDGHWRSGARVIRSLVEDGRGPMTVPGAKRDFVIGSRLLGELTAPEDLLERFRRVQWIEREGYRPAGLFEADREGGTFTFAVVLPGEDLFIPRADSALMDANPGKKDLILIDRARLPEVVGSAWAPLDEVQGCFRALKGSAWTAVVDRARAVSS